MPSLLPRSTRSRVGLALLAAVLGYSLLLSLVLGSVVFPAFTRIEREDAIRNLDRVAQALRRELTFLADFSRDWAHWDDTYDFVDNGNPAYVQSNLIEEVTTNLPADVIAIFASNGELRHLGIHRGVKPHAMEMRDLLAADGALYRSVVVPLLPTHSDRSRQETAIVRLDGRPLLAVGHAILHSDGRGPANGVMLMAGLLDADDLRDLKAQTLVDFDLHDAGSAPLLPVPPAELFRTSDGDEGRIEELGGEQLRLSVRFGTADGGTFIASSNYTRQITRQARLTLGVALALSVLSFGALVAVFYWGMLRRAFLTPLNDIVAELQRIEQAQDLGLRLPERGAEEIRRLAQAFNRMMHEVQVHRDEIAALSLTDPLTGLANRRQFEPMFEREFLHAQRQRTPLALLLLDVDSFKAFNDHYGHPAGDECLRRIAQTLDAGLRRGTDLLARLGGEEFVAVLAATDAEGARHVAEKLLQRVRALGVVHEYAETGCGYASISIGFKAGVPGHHEAPAQWLEAADAALYQAKRQGRDRCVAATA